MEQVVNIEELVQDDHNFNKGTKKGQALMEKSFTELGAGRSILIDKDGRIIAGNKSQRAAMAAGIKKVRVIESDGTELIAVKRTDVALDSKEGRELALADNVTTQVNLAWDKVELAAISELQGIDLPDWNLPGRLLEDQQFEDEFNSMGNDDAVYPIIPKYDERQELFIIVSENEVDANHLREILHMQKMKSYKTGQLMKSNVVHIKDVIHELENRNSQS